MPDISGKLIVPGDRPRARLITPEVSEDGLVISYNLPRGGSVRAELADEPGNVWIRGQRMDKRVQLDLTRADNTHASQLVYRFGRSAEDLISEGYPPDFFTAENLPAREDGSPRVVLDMGTGDGRLVNQLRDDETLRVDAHGVDPWLNAWQLDQPYFHLGIASYLVRHMLICLWLH